MILEHITCDLCGCEDYTERYRKPDNWLWLNLFEYPVVECSNCGLVYVNPRPIFEEISKFYPTDYHHNRDDDNHRKRYELQFSYIAQLHGKHILDIGCARGDWLNYLKKKWPDVDLHGVDAFSQGVTGNDINFHKCQLPEATLPNDYFDLITAWAVFEHLHTPSKYFKEVSSILRDGGKFVFLITNSESLYGRHAYKEDVPRHLYHFSNKTLEKYAIKYNLKLEHVFYDDRLWDGRGQGTFRFLLGRFAGVSWLNFRFNQYSFIQKSALKLGNLLDLLIFSKNWEAKIGRSGIMVVIVKKQNNDQ